MQVLSVDTNQIIEFTLVIIRTSSILFALPIFGDSQVPVKVRLLLSALLSILIFPQIDLDRNFVAFSTGETANLIISEVILTAAIAFIARMAFDAIVMAASVVGYQMGFGTADLLTGDKSTQISSFTALHRLLVILIFLSLNLHYVFIVGIVESFSIIEPGSIVLNYGSMADLMMHASAGIFTASLKLAAPILVALSFAMTIMGLIARTVPQMNVFTMSFPLSFFLGLIVYVASLTFYPQWLREHFEENLVNLFSNLTRLFA